MGVQGPYRHYVPSALWVSLNLTTLGLTLLHLRRIRRELPHKKQASF